MKKTIYPTNFLVAVEWCNNEMVMCNKLPEIDDSLYDNLMIPTPIDGGGDDLEDDEEESPLEIFQWFITDCSKCDVEYLQATFGLIFTYSDLLETYILCVDHYGTAWDYVEWTTININAKRKLGEKK